MRLTNRMRLGMYAAHVRFFHMMAAYSDTDSAQQSAANYARYVVSLRTN